MNTLEGAVARMVCPGFSGTRVPAETLRLLRRGISGVILFGRNVESPDQFASLCADLKDHANRPLLTCIDQEGGRVMRLRDPFTPLPPMSFVGQLNDPPYAEQIGRLLARELRSVNIDMNLAPVLDVNTNPANPVIGDRSFGPSPDLVSRMGCALIQGLQDARVAACGKHFPGHGDTSQDSHLHLPRLPHSLHRLQSVELPPFRAAIAANVAAIMTAHVIFEPLDNVYPATLSPAVLDGILRRQMGFDGVIISDDLEMKAIADHYGLEDALIRGASAGVDLFLVCHHPDLQHRAIDLLMRAVQRRWISEQRIAQSVRRIDALMQRYAHPPHRTPCSTVLNSTEHRHLARQIMMRYNTPAPSQPDPTEPLR